MRGSHWVSGALVLLVVACTSSSDTNGSGGNSNTDGGAGGGGSGDGGPGGGPGGSGDASTKKDAGSVPTAGNPDGSCSTALPSQAQAVDTSHADHTVGTGTAGSCTFASLATAVSAGGITTFNCGSAPVTITVTAPLTPPMSNHYGAQPAVSTVLDGGGKITLDGGSTTELINWVHPSGDDPANIDTLTLQNIALTNGKATGSMGFCSGTGDCPAGSQDGQGGALNVLAGLVRAINVTFANNQAALLGPDTGGGAVYIAGAGMAYFANCTFSNNTASNGGGLGMLNAGAGVYNSLFESNTAVGTGANYASGCTCSCNGNSECGSGGNGGALYKDGGDGLGVTICGTEIRDNTSNQFGPAVFFTADGNNAAKLTITDSKLENNTSVDQPGNWQWCTGVSTDNPHGAGTSPSPSNTSFCTSDSASSCSTTCSQ